MKKPYIIRCSACLLVYPIATEYTKIKTCVNCGSPRIYVDDNDIETPKINNEDLKIVTADMLAELKENVENLKGEVEQLKQKQRLIKEDNHEHLRKIKKHSK